MINVRQASPLNPGASSADEWMDRREFEPTHFDMDLWRLSDQNPLNLNGVD
jgi:hypothetical protein